MKLEKSQEAGERKPQTLIRISRKRTCGRSGRTFSHDMIESMRCMHFPALSSRLENSQRRRLPVQEPCGRHRTGRVNG